MDVAEHVGVTNPIASGSNAAEGEFAAGDPQEHSRQQPALSVRFGCSRSAAKFMHGTRELPEEVPHFAAAMYAREGDGSASLFELKRLAECLMEGCAAHLAQARPFEHPERAATIAWHGDDVGRLFELHPSLGVEGRAAILDLDLAKMERLRSAKTGAISRCGVFP